MTNYKKIAGSPEALGEFLGQLCAIDTPWNEAFHKKYCNHCPYVNCDDCPHEEYRENPLWWLGLEAERE